MYLIIQKLHHASKDLAFKQITMTGRLLQPTFQATLIGKLPDLIVGTANPGWSPRFDARPAWFLQ